MDEITRIEGILQAILKELQSNQIKEKSILNFQEAMVYMNVSDSYLYKRVCNRQIEHLKPSGGKIYFQKEILDQFLLSHTIKKNDIDKNANDYLQRKSIK